MTESKYVLFLDDDVYMLNAYRRMFRECSWVSILAEHPQQAKDALATYPVRVAFVDQMMPEMLGVDFLRWMKQYYPQVTGILLSGTDQLPVGQWLQHGWIDSFLQKPCSRQLLIETATNCLAADRL